MSVGGGGSLHESLVSGESSVMRSVRPRFCQLIKEPSISAAPVPATPPTQRNHAYRWCLKCKQDWKPSFIQSNRTSLTFVRPPPQNAGPKRCEGSSWLSRTSGFRSEFYIETLKRTKNETPADTPTRKLIGFHQVQQKNQPGLEVKAAGKP